MTAPQLQSMGTVNVATVNLESGMKKFHDALERRRFPWSIAIAISSLFFLGLSVSAFADVYNFYFKEKKQKVEQESENDNTPAQPPAPATSEAQRQTINVPTGQQQPIIINNTNNVGVPQTLPSTPAPSVPPVTVATLPATAAPEPTDEGHYPWRMALTGMVMAQEFKHLSASQGKLTSYNSAEPSWGGLVTLRYGLTRAIGVNVYGGARHTAAVGKLFYHLGSDVEFLPFRIPITNRFDLLQFGVLFGGSTALAAHGNIGTLHAGARFNLNFGRHFGVTVGARANLGYVMFEGGITARL